jgi:hypothetical protein
MHAIRIVTGMRRGILQRRWKKPAVPRRRLRHRLCFDGAQMRCSARPDNRAEVDRHFICAQVGFNTITALSSWRCSTPPLLASISPLRRMTMRSTGDRHFFGFFRYRTPTY